MAEDQPRRSREAGNRNRAQRQQVKRLQARQDFWAVDDESGGRPHRRSRAVRQVRRRS